MLLPRIGPAPAHMKLSEMQAHLMEIQKAFTECQKLPRSKSYHRKTRWWRHLPIKTRCRCTYVRQFSCVKPTYYRQGWQQDDPPRRSASSTEDGLFDRKLFRTARVKVARVSRKERDDREDGWPSSAEIRCGHCQGVASQCIECIILTFWMWLIFRCDPSWTVAKLIAHFSRLLKTKITNRIALIIWKNWIIFAFEMWSRSYII
jgi:hypothetical protein